MQAVNDYVLYGKSETDNPIAGKVYGIYNTAEMLEMVHWMRRYNERVPPDKKSLLLDEIVKLREQVAQSQNPSGILLKLLAAKKLELASLGSSDRNAASSC